MSYVRSLLTPTIAVVSAGTISRHSPDRQHSASASTSTGFLSPQRTTPSSSTAPSPHHKPVSLPLPASIFARRASNAGLASHPAHPSNSIPPPRPRLLSSYSRRKPSFSTPSLTPSLYSVSMQSESPSEMSMKSAGLSLKHVGDGALDDSDEEEEGSGHSAGKGSDADSDADARGGFDDNWGSTSIPSLRSDSGGTSVAEASASSRLSISPYLYPRTSATTPYAHPNPSPLSRVAGQQTWTEDEDERGDDEEDSPSPASSSDSESDSSSNEHAGSRSSKSKSSRRTRSNRTRSRSSTVASLAVGRPLLYQGVRCRSVPPNSRSRNRTVASAQ